MKKYFCLLLLLITSACVSSRFLYTDEKGRPIYQVSCNGAMRTYGDCLAEIGAQCPTGFEIVYSSEQSVGSASWMNGQASSQTNANAAASAFGNFANAFGHSQTNTAFGGKAFNMSAFNRYIIYACK